MFMKYLALISKFNGTHVITVGIFDEHDRALEEAKKAKETWYEMTRYYVIPLKENESICLDLHDSQKEYQEYCDKCGKYSKNLDLRNGQYNKRICPDCSFKEHLEWCESQKLK